MVHCCCSMHVRKVTISFGTGLFKAASSIALLNPCFIAAIQLATCVVERVLVHSNKGFHSPSQNLN